MVSYQKITLKKALPEQGNPEKGTPCNPEKGNPEKAIAKEAPCKCGNLSFSPKWIWLGIGLPKLDSRVGLVWFRVGLECVWCWFRRCVKGWFTVGLGLVRLVQGWFRVCSECVLVKDVCLGLV